MSDVTIDKKLIGEEFDVIDIVVKQDEALTFARACGETHPRFTDPSHENFQIPPTMVAKFVGRKIMPEGLKGFFVGTFDAGKVVDIFAPIRPGDKLRASSKIADIYEKTGRSGPMTFVVHRMEFTNQNGVKVACVDWRMVRRTPLKAE